MINLLKLTENDKRLIIVLLLVFILLFVLIGYVGLLVKKIMHNQGKKGDALIHDVVVSGVLVEPKKVMKFGIRKNYRQLFKEARIPILIILFGSIILLISYAVQNAWGRCVFDVEKGFGSLFYHLDWDNAPKAKFFGIELICDWPPAWWTPRFVKEAWGCYIFVPCLFVGGIWFLVCVQAYIARTYRIYKITKTTLNKSLENYKVENAPVEEIKPE